MECHVDAGVERRDGHGADVLPLAGDLDVGDSKSGVPRLRQAGLADP